MARGAWPERGVAEKANLIKSINSLKLPQYACDLSKSRCLLGKTLTPGNHIVLLELSLYKIWKLSLSVSIVPLKQECKKTVFVMKEMVWPLPGK